MVVLSRSNSNGSLRAGGERGSGSSMDSNNHQHYDDHYFRGGGYYDNNNNIKNNHKYSYHDDDEYHNYGCHNGGTTNGYHVDYSTSSSSEQQEEEERMFMIPIVPDASYRRNGYSMNGNGGGTSMRSSDSISSCDQQSSNHNNNGMIATADDDDNNNNNADHCAQDNNDYEYNGGKRRRRRRRTNNSCSNNSMVEVMGCYALIVSIIVVVCIPIIYYGPPSVPTSSSSSSSSAPSSPQTTTITSRTTTITTGTMSTSKRVKVFGIGLSKTGTTSMTEAFQNDLDYTNTIHTDRKFVPYMHHWNSSGPTFNFTGYYDSIDSVWDLPTAVYYKELLVAYPDAKFVLTVRDSEIWYNSFERYINTWLLARWGCQGTPIRIQRLHEYVYGSSKPQRDTWIQHYEQYNKDVIEHFTTQGKLDQLLVIDITKEHNKWYKICTFLDLYDVGPCIVRRRYWWFSSMYLYLKPFPHKNDADDHDTSIDCSTVIDTVEEDKNKNVPVASISDGSSNTTTKNPGTVEDSGVAVEESSTRKKYAYVMMYCHNANDEQTKDDVRKILVMKDRIRQQQRELQRLHHSSKSRTLDTTISTDGNDIDDVYDIINMDDIDMVLLVVGGFRLKYLELIQAEGIIVERVGHLGKDIENPDPYTAHYMQDYTGHPSTSPRCTRVKLRTLQLMQYERVIYLDHTNVFLKQSTDFLFRYSRQVEDQQQEQQQQDKNNTTIIATSTTAGSKSTQSSSSSSSSSLIAYNNYNDAIDIMLYDNRTMNLYNSIRTATKTETTTTTTISSKSNTPNVVDVASLFRAPFGTSLLVVTPSKQAFIDIADIIRSDSFYPDQRGWLDYGPPYDNDNNHKIEEVRQTLPSTTTTPVNDWSFRGAATDAGALYYYYDKILNHELTIISTRRAGTMDDDYDDDDNNAIYEDDQSQPPEQQSILPPPPYILLPPSMTWNTTSLMKFSTSHKKTIKKALKHWYKLWRNIEKRIPSNIGLQL